MEAVSGKFLSGRHKTTYHSKVFGVIAPDTLDKKDLLDSPFFCTFVT